LCCASLFPETSIGPLPTNRARIEIVLGAAWE
jgi:hypothetical protein